MASGLANRWNREGQKVIYCSSSRSLASLELLVHRNRIIPEEYDYIIHTEHPTFLTHVSILKREAYFWDSRLL